MTAGTAVTKHVNLEIQGVAMELQESTIRFMKKRAWEFRDAVVHQAAEAYQSDDYPNFKYKRRYVLDPWNQAEDGTAQLEEPADKYGWEKMDIFYAEMATRTYEETKDKKILNYPETPEGWLYIGDEKKVRYALGEPGGYNLVVIDLNPSTATPWKTDSTITRVRKIVAASGYDGWIMLNLYPKRTPKPSELPEKVNRSLADANQAVIQWVNKAFNIGAVYAAWGTNIESRAYLVDECQYIVDILRTDFWYSRGTTKYGHPKHPLYVPYDEPMEWFPVQDYLWEFE